MAKVTPTKTKRNKNLVRLRDEEGFSFGSLGKMFKISKARAKQIYDKEKKKRGSVEN